ncbi:hypothetical protein DFH06DRAFT_1325397 [Mycena polygramma]|nr:hypothetical protein DFH06DRAFT_1325397 [Mycena polygramma]
MARYSHLIAAKVEKEHWKRLVHKELASMARPAPRPRSSRRQLLNDLDDLKHEAGLRGASDPPRRPPRCTAAKAAFACIPSPRHSVYP